MPIRKAVRESAFRLARHDLAEFLKDHEEELIEIFREEIQALDDEIPEESLFIDIKMVPLGEAILKAALQAITRFLNDDSIGQGKKVNVTVRSEDGEPNLTLKNTTS